VKEEMLKWEGEEDLGEIEVEDTGVVACEFGQKG
jgi:hypothetical protein